MKRLLVLTSLSALLLLLLAVAASAKSGTRADLDDSNRLAKISQFNLSGSHPWMGRDAGAVTSGPAMVGSGVRRPVGSSQSVNVGPGVGVSIARTFDDGQYAFPIGRQVSHYWNGEFGENVAAGVHFAYELCTDTVAGDVTTSPILSGYNVYDAAVSSGNWPRGQDVGCGLQSADTIGTGRYVNLDVLDNELAVMTSVSSFFDPDITAADNLIYYQGSEFDCSYDPSTALNTTLIDSTVYRQKFVDPSPGNYSVQPEIATQFSAGNTITHVLLGEGTAFPGPTGDGYVTGANYRVFIHYRKVGNTSGAGTWGTGSIIDSIMEVYNTNGVTIAPSPNSGKVCISYSNPGTWGCLLDDQNSQYDADVFYRESQDYGVTWGAKVNVTNFQNTIAGDPKHFKAWVESPCLYDSNDDLHIIWTGTRTSADPYFDGFNWNDFDTDIYHWARSTDEVVRLAKGTYLNDDMLTGSINTIHCGFGGVHSGYIAFIWLSECDGKLYAVWNQMHELANHGDYTLSPELLEDCAYTGDRRGKANWEIMMSVARIESSSLWDVPRHVSGAGAGTHTPNCGLAGDPDATGGPCGNEFKPSVEKYGMDETGLDLVWPGASIVDLTPDDLPAYDGDFYLNMEYMDDQFPGYFIQDYGGRNDVGVFNSEKWVRLACVDPVEASIISVSPRNILWPVWVALGSSDELTLTVVNEGNVTLDVNEIGVAGGSWLSVTESPTPGSPFQVPAGVNNTGSVGVVLNATGLSGTQWLDGEVWFKSNAANSDSVSVPIHILAADEVESVRWDTVTTHQYMFDDFYEPVGACIALAVGNLGEVGYGAFSQGNVNLDYGESGLECGTRQRDLMYLASGSAFTLLAGSSAGANAELTMSFNDPSQVDEVGFDPVPDKGSIRGGLTAGGQYDSVYTGRFVNRDTTIAMERIVYGPRSATPATAILNFVVVYTKVYSADGQAHSHVTVGNACDFDVPADSPPNNNNGLSSGGFVYFQGTDTTGSTACQTNLTRFATEAFGGGYTSAEFLSNPCVNNTTPYGSNSLYQLLMEDTTHLRNGTDLVPDQPNPLVWWAETGVGGVNASALQDTDLALITTYVFDHTLGANDTLHYWTVLSTVRNGALTDLEAQVAYAKTWYAETVRGCFIVGCCDGKVGDANGSNEDAPTIGDVSVMIDAKFITGDCITEGTGANIRCIGEADINLSGGADPVCDDVTIGDISMLIDCLFITGEPPFVRNDCGNL